MFAFKSVKTGTDMNGDGKTAGNLHKASFFQSQRWRLDGLNVLDEHFQCLDYTQTRIDFNKPSGRINLNQEQDQSECVTGSA